MLDVNEEEVPTGSIAIDLYANESNTLRLGLLPQLSENIGMMELS
jgi:hypothetical protein